MAHPCATNNKIRQKTDEFGLNHRAQIRVILVTKKRKPRDKLGTEKNTLGRNQRLAQCSWQGVWAIFSSTVWTLFGHEPSAPEQSCGYSQFFEEKRAKYSARRLSLHKQDENARPWDRVVAWHWQRPRRVFQRVSHLQERPSFGSRSSGCGVPPSGNACTWTFPKKMAIFFWSWLIHTQSGRKSSWWPVWLLRGQLKLYGQKCR